MNHALVLDCICLTTILECVMLIRCGVVHAFLHTPKHFVGKFRFKNTKEMVDTNIAVVDGVESLPELPPVDSVAHSRHKRPTSATEAAAAKKWYEVDTPAEAEDTKATKPDPKTADEAAAAGADADVENGPTVSEETPKTDPKSSATSK